MSELDRKDSHLEICLNEKVESALFQNLSQAYHVYAPASAFHHYRFDHDALPEIDKSQVDLTATLFGKKLSAPLIIGAMTGGTEHASRINDRLALAAQKCQVGFALGSQRKMLEKPSTVSSYAVKKSAPNLPLLIGNLGAVQLNYGVGVPEIKQLIEAVECDVFSFHLNPLQEAIQPEGNTNFSGLLLKLKTVISETSIPVLVKEVGCGISEITAEKLSMLPLAGIETAGLGGTSWSKIESLRASNKIQKTTGELFSMWGIPTAESILNCRKFFPQRTVIASGGIRNGIEIAKSLALGADAVALALPFLKAAECSAEAVVEVIERLLEELRTVMFLTGSKNIANLKLKELKKTMDYTQ